MSAAVSLRGITKRFPGVVANDGVEFEAAEGEVHALLGENGAGKSTLSNILTGLYRPDAGEIFLYGRPVTFSSPRDALDAGVGMVHQHFRLVPPFTVAENVILGDHRGEGRKFIVHPRRVERHVAELGARYRIAVDPAARVWQLSLGEQQRVEILKALYRDARVLILDEPTAVLTPQEADVALRDAARDGGRGPHDHLHLAQAARGERGLRPRDGVARRQDRRDCRHGRCDPALAGVADGRPRDRADDARRARPDDRRAGARGRRSLGARATAAATRCAVSRSRFAPARSSGSPASPATASASSQRRSPGCGPPRAGVVTVQGRRLRGGDARDAIRAGVAHVPEDRLRTGVAPSLSIASNVVLKSYRGRRLAFGPLLRLRVIREHAAALIKRYDVRGGGPGLPARQLSGGNLQKVVLAREFEGEPRVLVVASPTRGLDVAAIETVHRYLRDAAAGGVGVLLISEDLDEILALSDRVAVMYEGALVGEVSADVATVEEIGLLMAGGAAA